MSRRNIERGREGEAAAAAFLQSKGYRIIRTDYRCPFGQIDIIARDGSTVCFVEVKSRSNREFGEPAEALNYMKQKKISKSALAFLKMMRWLDSPARFDVVSIDNSGIKPMIELLRDAFPLDESLTY